MLTHIEEVAARIKAGERLLLAGDEKLLLSLPKGEWIGGTIPYFMSDEGGAITREKLFVTPLPSELTEVQIATYRPDALCQICADAPDEGVTFLILPAMTDAHREFAENGPNYPGMYEKPLIGWIAGVHLDDLGKVSPKVVDGRTVTAFTDRGVALHARLPSGRRARIEIVNLFQPGDGPELRFEEAGFTVKECLVNGERRNLAEWITEDKVDTRLPLVADFSGVMVNVSCQSVDAASGVVKLYAPVFPHTTYRFAKSPGDYVAEFERAMPKDATPVFSCNCILNFLYSNLEGKKTPGITGPITFGEIAYQLLNQTLVYVLIEST